ncbi:MAG: DUF4331 domain-containing protein [Byssovorax sp.]
MMKRIQWMSAALTALGVLAAPSLALASSHREAPSISNDPAADNTDTYAWVKGTNLVVVADYIGLELPEGGPNWATFSDDVLYEVHMARGADKLSDALTYQIRFTTTPVVRHDPMLNEPAPAGGREFFGQLSGGGAFNQTYSVTLIQPGKAPLLVVPKGVVTPPNVGPMTNNVAYKIPAGKTYEQFFVDDAATTRVVAMAGGGSAFAGPRDDPFFVDLGGVFDLAQIRPVANPAEAARDSIKYMNVHSIVLEIPLVTANGGAAPIAGPHAAQTVGVWASASRQTVSVLRKDGTDDHYGPWRQVSRLGLPLINEAVIGVQDKDGWNRRTPSDDATYYAQYFDKPIIVRDAEAIGFYGAGGPLAACVPPGGLPALESGRLGDIVPIINLPDHVGAEKINSIGDVIRVDLGQPSGFPNGRQLQEDVVDVELKLLLCTLNAGTPFPAGIPDGPTGNETPFKATFPYVAAPWEGRSANPRPVNSLP